MFYLGGFNAQWLRVVLVHLWWWLWGFIMDGIMVIDQGEAGRGLGKDGYGEGARKR